MTVTRLLLQTRRQEAVSYEMFVNVHQRTWHHRQEDHNDFQYFYPINSTTSLSIHGPFHSKIGVNAETKH
jgi:hypothetical protein